VADPQQLLEQVVGQQFDSTNLGDEAAAGEPTWLQIGANTMDSTLNSNDPMKALLDSIPTWRKVGPRSPGAPVVQHDTGLCIG
jgi:hypothetical protein